MILRLVWSPFSLARTAAGTTTRRAVIAAFLAVSLQLGLVHSVATINTLRGFKDRDMGDYVGPAGIDALFFGLRCGVYGPFLAIPFLLAALSLGLFLDKHTQGALTKRVLLLSPVALLLPVIIWSACLLLLEVEVQDELFVYILIHLLLEVTPIYIFLLAIIAVALRRVPAVSASMGPPSHGRCEHAVMDRGGEDSGMYCRSRGCAYNLHGLPENRCPECGRPFDPNNPRSFRRSPLGSFTDWCLKPIGPITFSLIGVPSILLLYLALYPGFYYLIDH